jgi:hypothetical protein
MVKYFAEKFYDIQKIISVILLVISCVHFKRKDRHKEGKKKHMTHKN